MINHLLIILLTAYGVHSIGHLAASGHFSYVVSIWYSNNQMNTYKCSGTLIDRKHILTRAQCVNGIDSSMLSVIAGATTTRKPNKQILKVKSIHVHYGFMATYNTLEGDGVRYLHDIAVIKLQSELIWNQQTAPAELPSNVNFDVEGQYIMPFWSDNVNWEYRGHIHLRWAETTVITDEQCKASGVRLLKNEKCTHLLSDSRLKLIKYQGSPIISGHVVIGIMDNQRSGNFSIFLNIRPYLDFIADAIDEGKNNVNLGEIPYVVSIWHQGRFRCGGTILDATHILTTGHGVLDLEPMDLRVVAGNTQVIKNNNNIKWSLVRKIFIHPDYAEITCNAGPLITKHFQNNYAILTLAESLTYGPTIGPVFFSTSYPVAIDETCGTFRWHYAYTVDDEALIQLLWSPGMILTAQDCRRFGISVDANHFCASNPSLQRTMNFESSGNPVVCGPFIVGIIVSDFSKRPEFPCLTNIIDIVPMLNFIKHANDGN